MLQLWCLRVYQVDTWHTYFLGQETSQQSLVVVVMATSPVFDTFPESWKTKTPKSWKKIRPCNNSDVSGSNKLIIGTPVVWAKRHLYNCFSFVIATRPLFGTFSKIVRLRLRFQKKKKQRIF